jgi:hypothetical protein
MRSQQQRFPAATLRHAARGNIGAATVLSTILSRESLSFDLPHSPRGHVEASPETCLKGCKLLRSDQFAAEKGPHIAGAAVNRKIFKPIGPSRENVPRIEVRAGLGAFEIQSERNHGDA